MSTLLHKSCRPLPEGTAALDVDAVKALLNEVSGWAAMNNNTFIVREIHFKNYYETMAFVNALAWIAHQEDHHPDLEVSYNRCKIIFNTHTVKGLSENDFICAAKVNQLLSFT